MIVLANDIIRAVILVSALTALYLFSRLVYRRRELLEYLFPVIFWLVMLATFYGMLFANRLGLIHVDVIILNFLSSVVRLQALFTLLFAGYILDRRSKS